jgi:hypothetical protein
MRINAVVDKANTAVGEQEMRAARMERPEMPGVRVVIVIGVAQLSGLILRTARSKLTLRG